MNRGKANKIRIRVASKISSIRVASKNSIRVANKISSTTRVVNRANRVSRAASTDNKVSRDTRVASSSRINAKALNRNRGRGETRERPASRIVKNEQRVGLFGYFSCAPRSARAAGLFFCYCS
jgi:hypothetical protein